jgi:hypothetical protein
VEQLDLRQAGLVLWARLAYIITRLVFLYSLDSTWRMKNRVLESRGNLRALRTEWEEGSM